MNLKDEVYLNIAKEVARLSKDENTKVGSVIVDKDGVVVSTGRNGTVSGFDDSVIPLSREEKKVEYWENGNKQELITNKYSLVRHSEENCIAFAENRNRLNGATIYVTGMPCPRCALAIAQSKISRVVIPSEWVIKSITEQDIKVTKFIFSQGGIELQIGDNIIKLDSNYLEKSWTTEK